jgi:hypothetical protein
MGQDRQWLPTPEPVEGEERLKVSLTDDKEPLMDVTALRPAEDGDGVIIQQWLERKGRRPEGDPHTFSLTAEAAAWVADSINLRQFDKALKRAQEPTAQQVAEMFAERCREALRSTGYPDSWVEVGDSVRGLALTGREVPVVIFDGGVSFFPWDDEMDYTPPGGTPRTEEWFTPAGFLLENYSLNVVLVHDTSKGERSRTDA